MAFVLFVQSEEKIRLRKTNKVLGKLGGFPFTLFISMSL